MRRILLTLLLVVAACTTNPITGRGQALYNSPDKMNELGVQAYAEMTGPKSKARVLDEPRFTEPLRRVGGAISRVADSPRYRINRAPFKWEFRVIDDPKTVNAWALPGGKIAFYTGIYPILQDEAGMAIVMGHEVMHAVLEHSNERMSQQQLQAIGLTVGAVAVGVSDLENSEKAALIAVLGVGSAVGVILPYSRLHESEADRWGLYLAAEAGYDPEAAIGVWTRMANLSQGKRPPEILSTHPDPVNRIENMKRWMPEAKALYERSRKMPNNPLPRVK
ncbi:MAG: M48 family metallopeptidase [Planctomycetota bacterium]|jgi:predicted Zn-dependent protease